MCNYSSMDGVLYCKTHFEQLFKETGSFSKKFSQGNAKTQWLSRCLDIIEKLLCSEFSLCPGTQVVNLQRRATRYKPHRPVYSPIHTLCIY